MSMKRISILTTDTHVIHMMGSYSDDDLWELLSKAKSMKKMCQLEGRTESGETVHVRIDPEKVISTVVMPWVDPGKIARPVMVPRGQIKQ